jgi:hypothetical protein
MPFNVSSDGKDETSFCSGRRFPLLSAIFRYFPSLSAVLFVKNYQFIGQEAGLFGRENFLGFAVSHCG